MRSTGKGKTTGTRILLILLTLLSFSIRIAYALPSGETVIEGSATFDRSESNVLKINTTSDKLIVDYNSFSIGANESVYFYQPSSGAMALNRVTGSDVSGIFGSLMANGIIYLINPNGINIGSSANINAAGFIASTLNIANVDFLSSNFVFTKLADKVGRPVFNNGYIRVRETGQVALLGSAVANAGTIETSLGSVVLAAGEQITLNLDTAGMISVVINEPVKEEIYGFGGEKLTSAVSQSGTVVNPGGKVILAAKVLNNVFDYAINNSGIVQAQSLVSHDGIVELMAEGAPILNAGTVEATRVQVVAKSAPVTNTGVIKANEVKVVSEAAPVVNTGQIIATGAAGVTDSGNIDISAVNILQAGIISATESIKLVATDKVESPYIETTTQSIASGEPISISPGIIIQAPHVTLIARQFGTTSAPLNIEGNYIYLSRTQGNIDILQSLGIGTSVLVRGPPDGFGAIYYNKTANLELQATQVNLVSSQSFYFYGNITFHNFQDITPDSYIYFEAGKTYTFKGSLAIIGAPDAGPEEFFVKLRSSVAGQYWYLGVEADNYTLERVNLSDSYALNKVIIPIGVDAGNNVNFEIDPTWDGGGTTNNWSEADNWDGNTVPTASTDATFNATSVKDSTVDAAFAGTIRDLLINAGYTGTITFERSLSARNFSQADGTVSLGSQSLTLSGTFSLSGGTFNANSAAFNIADNFTISGTGVFNEGTSTVTFTGAGATINILTTETFFNLTFAPTTLGAAKTVAASDTLIVTGTLTLTEGNINQGTIPASGTISAQGDITQASTFDGGTGLIIISGSANQTFTGNATTTAGELTDITIDKSAGTLTLAGTIRTNAQGAGAWTYTAGTIDPGTSTVVFDGGMTITGSHILYNVTFNNAGTRVIASGTTLTVTGTLNYNDGTLNTGTIAAQGDIIQGSATDGGSAILQITGTANQTFTGNATVSAGELPDLTINKTGGTLTLAGTIRTNAQGAGAWTYTAGTIDAGTSTVVFDGAMTITGSHTLNNVTLNSAGIRTFADGMTLTVTGTFTLTDGNINQGTIPASGTISAQGDITQASTFDGGTGLILITGTANQTFTGNATTSAGDLPDITINKSGGTLTLAGTIRINGSGAGAWTYIAGTVDATTNNSLIVLNGTNTIDGQGTSSTMAFDNIEVTAGTTTLAGNLDLDGNLTISGGTLDTSASNFSINVAGNWSNSGTFDANNGTVTFDGAGTQTLNSGGTAASKVFNNLTHSGAGTLQLITNAITINGNFTNSASTFDANGLTMSIGGNWSNSATFTAAANTVNFTSASTQTLNSGGSAFSNITHSGSGTLQLVSNALTVTSNFTNSSGTFDLNGQNWIMTGAAFSNAATVKLQGGETITGLTQDIDSGTWAYAGDGDGVVDTFTIADFGATDYFNLTINDANATKDIFQLGNSLSVAGAFTVTAGTFNANAQTTTVTGLTTVNGGTYQASTATQTFNGSLTISSGTFTGSSGAVAVNGTFTQSGGVFTAPSGTMSISVNFTRSAGTFDANGGTITFTSTAAGRTIESAGASFYNLIFNGIGGAWTLQDALSVGNDITITNGTLSTGANGITVSGSWSKTGGTFTPGTGTVTFNSTSTGKTIASGGAAFNNLTFNGIGGAWTLQDALDVNGNLTITNGTLNAGANSINIDGNLTISSGGAFSEGTSTVILDGAAATIDVNVTETFYNLTFAPTTLGAAKTVAASDTLIVTGTLTLTEGNINQGTIPASGTISAQGNITQASTFDGGTGLIIISGSANQTFTGNATTSAGDLNDITIDKSAGTLTLAGTIRINGSGAGAWTYIAGTVDATTNNSLIVLNGGNTIDGQGTSSTMAFDNIEITAGTQTLAGNLDVDGNLTISAGTLNTSGSDFSVNVAGNWSNSGTFTSNSSVVTLDGSSDSTMDTGGTAAGNDFQTLVINKSGGAVVTLINNNLDIDGTLTITSGVLYLNGRNITTTTSFSNNGTLRLQGIESVSWTVNDTDSGTWEYVGRNIAETIAIKDFGAADYFNLTINDTNTNKATFSSGTALDVNGALTLSGGTLTAPTVSFTVAGNWVNNGGTFNAGTGTVTFDGTTTISGVSITTFNNIIITGTLTGHATNMNVKGNWTNSGTSTHNSGTVTFIDNTQTSVISGSTTFFNFTSTTAGKQITFTAGTTQTIGGTLTLTGASGNLIVLRSSVSASQWSINPQGSKSVSFVDVKDSNNVNASEIAAADSKDSGNNTNWNLVDHFVITGSGTQNAGASQALTITAIDGVGGVSTSYSGDKALIFSGAGSTSISNPTVTDKNGVAVNFGSNTTITFTSGVSSSGGSMVLYKVETASIAVSQGAIGTTSPLSVVVSVGAASKLLFIQQPSNAPFGAIISPIVTVQVSDEFDNAITSDNSTSVTIAIGVNAAGGILSGNTTIVVSAGIASFSNLSIDFPGNGYTLVASASGLTGATSNAFNITGSTLTAAQAAVANSQISTADILRILLPDAIQLNLYQVNTFIPTAPVYLYHPLTPEDIAMFEDILLRRAP